MKKLKPSYQLLLICVIDQLIHLVFDYVLLYIHVYFHVYLKLPYMALNGIVRLSDS